MRTLIFFSTFSCSTIGLHPKKDLTLNNSRTNKVIELFYIRAFIWQPKGGGLINLAKLALKLYFFGKFFQNFKEFET
jgi:hypothetical protein